MAIKTLLDKLAPFFDGDTRNNGWEYVRAQRIKIRQGSKFAVKAIALGTQEYRVTVRVDGGDVYFYCGCETFRRKGPCKHLWATAVDAERLGYLTDIRWTSLELNLNIAQGPDDLPGEAALPNWRLYLRDIDAKAGVTPQRRIEPRPADEQILYFVDPLDTLRNGRAISLQILARTPNLKGGDWNRTYPLRLSLDQLQEMPDPSEDREILLALAGSRGVLSTYATYPAEEIYNNYELSPPLGLRLLPILCGTGRCFLKSPNSEERSLAQPLTWDPEPFGFRLLWQQGGDGSWQISAEFFRDDEMLALDSSTLIVASSFLLRRRAIDTQDHPCAAS